MRIKLLIIGITLFMLGTFSKSFAQWETLHFPDTIDPTLPWLNSVYFNNYNEGMAAGFTFDFRAIILRSYDGGIVWDTVLVTTDTLAFKDIIFTDSLTAYAVGDRSYCCNPAIGIISKTTDFGNTWTTTMVNAGLYSVFFASDSIGYAVGWDGINGVIFKTTDAGTNWLSQNASVGLTSVFFLNDTVGFTCGSNVILKTNNGATTWNTYNAGTQSLYNSHLFFPSDSIGYFKGEDGDTTFIYKTIDAGNTWNLQSIIPNFYYKTSLFFTDDTTGYISGQFTMLKTIDGASTWDWQNSCPPSWWAFMDDVMHLHFINHDTGFAVGWDQVYRTTIGGECIYDFTYSTSGPNANFFDSTMCAYNWSWDFGDGNTDTLQNSTNLYADTRNYIVCLTVSNPCGIDTICQTISIDCTPPIANFEIEDTVATINLTDSSSGAINWYWDFGDGDTSVVQSPSHTYSSSGTYQVCLTVSNGCGTDSICQTVSIIIDDVINLNRQIVVTINPNPFREYATLLFTENSSSKYGLSIYDQRGRLVQGVSHIHSGYKIIGKGLQSGLYFFKINQDNKPIGLGKLIIED